MRQELRFIRRSMKRESKLKPKFIANEHEKRKKRLITFVTGILLSLLYVAIFGFSAQDADESGGLSREVTEKCVETVTELSGKKVSASEKDRLVDRFEKPVRKMAHFTEYTAMGMLVCIWLAQWYEKSRARFRLNIGWVFVSAAFDEWHQYFVPGRYASVWDVLLDTAGGVFGVCLAALGCRLFFQINRISLRRKDI